MDASRLGEVEEARNDKNTERRSDTVRGEDGEDRARKQDRKKHEAI